MIIDREKLREVGYTCKLNRVKKDIKLEAIALATGYTKENIMRFESGLNNNLLLFLYYLENGLYEI